MSGLGTDSIDPSFMERWQCWMALCDQFPAATQGEQMFMLREDFDGERVGVTIKQGGKKVKLYDTLNGFPTKEFLGKLLLCLE